MPEIMQMYIDWIKTDPIIAITCSLIFLLDARAGFLYFIIICLLGGFMYG